MGRARYGLSIFLCLASAIPISTGRAADQVSGPEQSAPAQTPSVADVQDALVWTGDFDGMVDGKTGSRTKAAIKAFQESRGYDETSILTIEEWNGLSALAEAARDRVGWTSFVDRAQHWSVSYPAKQLTRIERPTLNTVVLRSDDNAYGLKIDVAMAPSPEEIEAAFGKETSAGDGRTITYARKTDRWYVVTGAKAGQDFYLKAIHCAGAEFTLRFSWPTAKRAEMQPVVVAMVNSLVVPENLTPMQEVAGESDYRGLSGSDDHEDKAASLEASETTSRIGDVRDTSLSYPVEDESENAPGATDTKALLARVRSYAPWGVGALALFLILRQLARAAERNRQKADGEAMEALVERYKTVGVPAEEPVKAPSPAPREIDSRRNHLLELKNEVINRRQEGRTGLLTEWVRSQTEFPSPDHVPVDRAVDMVFKLYGGFDGLKMFYDEGLLEYVTVDAAHAFGQRSLEIMTAMAERMIEIVQDDDF